MKPETIELIKRVLSGDDSVSPEMSETILRTARQAVPKRKLISAKAAMAILEISRPTLRDYVKRGLLEQINLSSRKVRFVEDEVNLLAYGGRNALPFGKKSQNYT